MAWLYSSRMNSEMYRTLFFAQCQPNAAKLIRCFFILQMDKDSKPTIKLPEAKEFERRNPTEHSFFFFLLKTRLCDWNSLSMKEPETSSSWRPGRKKGRKLSTWTCLRIPNFRQLLMAKDFYPNIKDNPYVYSYVHLSCP